jgi:hypothetical protein
MGARKGGAELVSSNQKSNDWSIQLPGIPEISPSLRGTTGFPVLLRYIHITAHGGDTEVGPLTKGGSLLCSFMFPCSPSSSAVINRRYVYGSLQSFPIP